MARVLRGGAFHSDANRVRCASRDDAAPDDRYFNIGFRVVVSPFFSER
jgi:formylglycine-generating enzyme required for sulfatase activity